MCSNSQINAVVLATLLSVVTLVRGGSVETMPATRVFAKEGTGQASQQSANMTLVEIKNLLRQGVREADELEGILDNRWRALFGEVVGAQAPWLSDYFYHRLRADLVAKAAGRRDTVLTNRLKVFYYSGIEHPDKLSGQDQIERCARLLTYWPDSYVLHLKKSLPRREWRVVHRISVSYPSEGSARADVWVGMGMTADEHSISFTRQELNGKTLWIPTNYEWRKGPYEFDGKPVGNLGPMERDLDARIDQDKLTTNTTAEISIPANPETE